MSAQEPGQAEYEAFRAAVPDHVCNVPAGPWSELSPAVRGGFAAIAARRDAEIRLLQMRLADDEERAAESLAGLTAFHALKRLADPMPFGDQGKPLPPEAELRRDYAQAALEQAAAERPGLAGAIREHIKQKAAEFSAEVFPVRPEDMRVSAADILAIVDRAASGEAP